MSISTEIERINTSVVAAYNVLEGMGAAMPANETVDNLAATAATVNPPGTVRYDKAQSLTDTQKTQARTNIGAAGTAVATTSADGLMSTSDKTKLNDTVSKSSTGVQTIKGGLSLGGTATAGTGIGRLMLTGNTNPLIGIQQQDTDGTIRTPYYFQVFGDNMYLGPTSSVATKWDRSGNVTIQGDTTITGSKSLNVTGNLSVGGTLSAKTATATAAGLMSAADKKKVDLLVVTVKDYGAKGDGSTDDTTAFQNALAAERVVYVPSGTYKLSGELILGQNCQLELEQDVLLNFTQTTGNCISMKASSNIVGNHATINVPYAFTGRVINIYAGLDESIVAVPPHPNWGPMWTAARYITDLHITKNNASGVAKSNDGACSGTAVYLGASTDDTMHFMWAIDLDRLRIAGAFKYGIHMDVTPGTTEATKMRGWIHQTRISAFVAHAEVGIYCKDATLSYLSVMVLPNPAVNDAVYAKHGIILENCTEVDLSGSRIMDWDSAHTLWKEGNEYQHIKLIGNCSGLILNEHFYYSNPNYDIRSLIYTDTPSNLDKLTILQEPFTRWFKPIDHTPYFFDGDVEKKLVLDEELKEIVDTERTANFTNKIPTAINLDGTILNGTGYYKSGYRWASNGTLIEAEWYGCTGLIPAKPGDLIRAQNLSLIPHDANCLMVFFDANRNYVGHMNNWDNIAAGLAYYWLIDYVESDNSFEVRIANTNGAVKDTKYVAFAFQRANIGEQPIITVNEPITHSQNGYLQDGILVKPENVEGLTEILGSYIDDVDALLGGG